MNSTFPAENEHTVVLNGHPMFNAGFAWLLTGADDMRVAASGHDLADAVNHIDAHLPDVVVVDFAPSSGRGVDLVRSLAEHAAGVRLLLMADTGDELAAFPTLPRTTYGYLPKSSPPQEILSAIRSVACGSMVFGAGVSRTVCSRLADRGTRSVFPALTEREHEVLGLAANGLANMDIARRLHVAAKTVRNHMSNILVKLRVAGRADAIDLARRSGLGGTVTSPPCPTVGLDRVAPTRTPPPARSLPQASTARESATTRAASDLRAVAPPVEARY